MASKRRKEQYASPISDEQRRELVERVRRGKASDEDKQTLADEGQRTVEKSRAAIDQLAHPGDTRKALFEAPERSAMSVTATVDDLRLSIADWDASTKGHAHIREQRRKASLPRTPVTQIISDLVHFYPDETSSELWTRFLGFEQKDFSIKDCGDYVEWSDKVKNIEKAGSMTFAAFKVAVSLAKRKVK